MKIFVGNLSFGATEEGLRSLFTQHGNVDSVSILTHRDTGQSRGFGFVEMSDVSAARKAMDALNGTDFEGRTLNISEARPREERSSGGDRRGGQRQYNRY